MPQSSSTFRSRFTSLKSRRITAGLSIGDLAKRAGVGDWDIINTESNSGTLQTHHAQLIANAIASAVISTSSVANPSTITTATPHGFVTGETATISGHTSTPTINGDRVVTVVTSTTFTIPINVTVGGSGGFAQLALSNIGQVEI